MNDMKNNKILLIESPYSYGKDSIVVGKYFPLGIGYLAAFLRGNGNEVRIFQPRDDAKYHDECIALLREFQPRAVGISVMTSSYPNAVELCGLVKRNSDAATILGGHHVSAVGRQVMAQSPDTDFAVIGEGEETLTELMRKFGEANPDLSQTNGLIWRDAGEIRENAPRGLIGDLDSLPFPARDLVDISQFRIHSYIDFGKKSTTMITSRGCPFKCMFCSSWLTMGAKYRYRSAENVLDEVREITDRFGIDHIVFEDDTMTLRRDRIEAICDGFTKLPDGIRPTWYCLSRVDTMDLALAKRMRAAGCRMVSFGIESGSPEILKKIGKKISIDKAREAVQACTRAGLRTHCTFIVGFPDDTDETMKSTLKAAIAIGPTIAIFFPLTPYPGTVAFNEYLDKSLAPSSVEQWRGFVMTGSTGNLSLNKRYTGEQILRTSREWNHRFFFRPRQLFRLARSVSSVSDFFRLLRGGVYLLRSVLKR